MSNPFDQFDNSGQGVGTPTPVNPFDQFDNAASAAPPQPKNTWGTMGKNFLAGLEEAPGALVDMLGHSNPENEAAYSVGLQHDSLTDRNPSQDVTNSIAGVTHFDPATVPSVGVLDKISRGVGQSAPLLPLGAESLPANLARGVGSVTGSTLAQEAVPDEYKRVAGLVGGLLGGSPELATLPVTAAKRSLISPNPNAAATAADFATAGVRPPTASSVTGNPNLAYLEAGLSKTPGGAGVYHQAFGNTLDDLQNQIEGTTQVISGKPSGTPEQTGSLIQKGIQNASDRVKARQSDLYDKALNPVVGTPLAQRSLPNMEQLSSDLTQEFSEAPESRAGTAGNALNRVNAVLRDASAGNATLGTLRSIRTELGRDIQDPLLAGVSSSQQPFLRRIYGALSDDINSVATAADPTGQVQKNLATADRYTRQNSQRLDFLQDFLGSKTADQVYTSALASGKGGGATLMSIRKALKPEEWDQVAGTTFGRLGLAKPGAQAASGIAQAADTFSPSTFMTNWSTMSPEAKQALFGGTRYAKVAPAIDRLVRVTDQVAGAQKLTGGSPTYERAAHVGLFSAMGYSGINNLMQGKFGMAIGEPAAMFLAGHVAPKMAAQKLTDPAFVNALANRISAQTPAGKAFADKALKGMMVGTLATPQGQAN